MRRDITDIRTGIDIVTWVVGVMVFLIAAAIIAEVWFTSRDRNDCIRTGGRWEVTGTKLVGITIGNQTTFENEPVYGCKR